MNRVGTCLTVGRMAQPNNSGWFFVALGVLGIAGFSSLASVTETLGPASIPIWMVVTVGSVFALRGPLGKAIAARLTGQRLDEGAVMEVPQEVYAELDELRARVAELEERTDFTERMLARPTQDDART